MEFADALRIAMGKETTTELANRSGIPDSTISRHLHREHRPTYTTLQKYHKALPRLKRLLESPAAPAKAKPRAGAVPRQRSVR